MFYQVSVFHRYLQDYENFVIFASDISQATDRARRLCSSSESVCGIVSLGDNPQTGTRGLVFS
jgi:hypothetical protein